MTLTVITWFDLPLACRPGHPQRRRPTLDEVKSAVAKVEAREHEHAKWAKHKAAMKAKGKA